ncbi:hypothetical protein CXG81DRAFT_26384 [Caulochytrium protostelioides]|uniref:Dolichyldiphosphatase n=1 Tax=Caulochytrium protostelioides TaxID=1555241 RepID=A0A4P9X6X0_9FUNG|nr:dolichyl pyrophosphate phosphatase 1, isoform CRA_e [Caulochytrium protostelioides]RKP00938.1 hypothetical protein CXG81DRAFT_26384 [Caulochytrium protostelioides]|eukprot:RKP00938.1 hypothetical protein CXG81DRAFT_26384 [Caulochytrium protostelioides]
MDLPGGGHDDHAFLASVSITHVQYDEDDVVALVMAYISLLPIFCLAAYAVLVLFQRDAATIVALAGQLANEAINYALKKLVRQPRPVSALKHGGYGMPSSHAQFTGFLTTYTAIALLTRVTWRQTRWKAGVLAGLATAGILVPVSRVYLRYHTAPQAVVGTVVGVGVALLWHVAVARRILPLPLWVRRHPITTFLLIRDITLVPNWLQVSYDLANRLADQHQKTQ